MDDETWIANALASRRAAQARREAARQRREYFERNAHIGAIKINPDGSKGSWTLAEIQARAYARRRLGLAAEGFGRPVGSGFGVTKEHVQLLDAGRMRWSDPAMQAAWDNRHADPAAWHAAYNKKAPA